MECSTPVLGGAIPYPMVGPVRRGGEVTALRADGPYCPLEHMTGASRIDFRSAMSASDMEADGNDLVAWLLIGLFPGETACNNDARRTPCRSDRRAICHMSDLENDVFITRML